MGACLRLVRVPAGCALQPVPTCIYIVTWSSSYFASGETSLCVSGGTFWSCSGSFRHRYLTKREGKSPRCAHLSVGICPDSFQPALRLPQRMLLVVRVFTVYYWGPNQGRRSADIRLVFSEMEHDSARESPTLIGVGARHEGFRDRQRGFRDQLCSSMSR